VAAYSTNGSLSTCGDSSDVLLVQPSIALVLGLSLEGSDPLVEVHVVAPETVAHSRVDALVAGMLATPHARVLLGHHSLRFLSVQVQTV